MLTLTLDSPVEGARGARLLAPSAGLDGTGIVGRVFRVDPASIGAWRVWRAAVRPCARILASLLVCGAVSASLVACGGGGGTKLGERVIPLGQPVPKGGGRYAVGEPYQINGVWYRPREEAAYDKVGVASWYGELFHGRRTANGEIYDMERLSAASPTLPMPAYAKVTNLANGRSLVVRVNDRGPYRSSRVMDVSRRSAELLGFREKGTTRVRVQYLRPAPLNGDDSFERSYAANMPDARVASRTEFHVKDPIAVGSFDNGGGRVGTSPQPMTQPRRPVREGDMLVSENERVMPLAEEEAQQVRQSPGRRRPPSVPSRAPAVVAEAPPIPAQSPAGNILIQAGSFKSRDNADRAKSLLGAIAGVEVAPVDSGGSTVFRVRVGPFADRGEAAAALARVNEAGYAGARIVTN